ncbi:MAG: hypothetical protein ACPGQL_04315 [Thermoplasmatota archaeon]
MRRAAGLPTLTVTLALVATGALAGCLSDDDDDGAMAVPGQPFAMDGRGCKELLVNVPATADDVRPLVASGYQMLGEETGQVTLFAGLQVCDELLLDGIGAGPASTSDVGVLIQSPDGTPGLHYYQLWWLTDHAGLAERLQAMGWDAGYVPETNLTDGRQMDLLGPVAASIPWAGGAYSVTANVLALPLPMDADATGWQDGPFGTVTVAKNLASDQFGTGIGSIVARDGPLASALGGGVAQGTALVNLYQMRGMVDYGDAS